MHQDKFENPFPFFADAADAASRYVAAQREYLIMSAELRARRETRRLICLAVALIFVNIAATMGLFWITVGLHEAGWSSWVVALVAFVFLGSCAGIMTYVGIKAGRAPEKGPLASTSLSKVAS